MEVGCVRSGLSLEVLLTTPHHSDVVFIVGPEEVRLPAHRAVLAAHSEVLASMLASPCQEGTSGIVSLPDFEPQVVQCFLRLCYGSTALPAPDLLPPLLRLVHLYQIPKLGDMLGTALSSSIDCATALKYFVMGCEFDARPLREAALQHIRQNATAVLSAAITQPESGLADFAPDHLLLLLQDDHLVVEELLLWEVALHWAHGNEAPLADTIAPLLPHIRWSLMSQAGLREVAEFGVVPPELLLPAALGCTPGGTHRPRCALAASNQQPGAHFSLHCVHDAWHHTYHWQVPILHIGPEEVRSDPFHIGDVSFRLVLRPNDHWLQAFLVVVQPGSTAACIVFLSVSVLEHETLRRLETNRNGRDGQHWRTPGAEWGWPKFLDRQAIWSDIRSLHGPQRDSLLLEIDVQLLGPYQLAVQDTIFKDALAAVPFDLTVPKSVFKDCTVQLDACGCLWHLRIHGCMMSGHLSLRAVDWHRKLAPRYEFRCYLLHPTDDAATESTAQSKEFTPNPTYLPTEAPMDMEWRWALRGLQVPAGVQDYPKDAFVWPHGGVVFRCCLRELEARAKLASR